MIYIHTYVYARQVMLYFVCIHICMYVCAYVHTYTYIHKCVRIFVCIYVCMYVYARQVMLYFVNHVASSRRNAIHGTYVTTAIFWT
jgi:hypothetical protein